LENKNKISTDVYIYWPVTNFSYKKSLKFSFLRSSPFHSLFLLLLF